MKNCARGLFCTTLSFSKRGAVMITLSQKNAAAFYQKSVLTAEDGLGRVEKTRPNKGTLESGKSGGRDNYRILLISVLILTRRLYILHGIEVKYSRVFMQCDGLL